MKKIIILFFISLFALSFAQRYDCEPNKRPYFRNQKFNERTVNRLQHFKQQKLLEELSITDATKINNIKQIFSNSFNYIHQLQFEKRELLDNLENAFNNNDINKAIDIANKIYVIEKNFTNARIKYFDDMKTVLNNEEYAKFILFEYRFQQHLKNFIEKRKKR